MYGTIYVRVCNKEHLQKLCIEFSMGQIYVKVYFRVISFLPKYSSIPVTFFVTS